MTKSSSKQRLVDFARTRNVSFVLGAGVSKPYSIPGWDELARRIWQRAFPRQPSPWKASPGQSPHALPQLLPIVFELARNELGDKRFTGHLRGCLYPRKKAPLPGRRELLASTNSLAVIARVVLEQYQADERRLVRVITLNADDLLEEALNQIKEGKKKPWRTIIRPSQYTTDRGDGRAIPIYHPHGFLIRRARLLDRKDEHTLVFTDSQYWALNTTMQSVANYTMGTALHDSHCIFVGLSMTDINLLRWLALRTLGFVNEGEERSKRQRTGTRSTRARPDDRTSPMREVRQKLNRHFWIRPVEDDPTGLLSRFLPERGVSPVSINSWKSDEFAELMERCFPKT